jgi:hypothetical protein
MSFNTTCNVEALRVVDLRLRSADNVPAGRFSTLFTGSQESFGYPLTWDYVLLDTDLIKLSDFHSTSIQSIFSNYSSSRELISTYREDIISTIGEKYQILNEVAEGVTLDIASYEIAPREDELRRLNDIVVLNEPLNVIASRYDEMDNLYSELVGNFLTIPAFQVEGGINSIFLSDIQGMSSTIFPRISTISSLALQESTIRTLAFLNFLNETTSTISSRFSTTILHAETSTNRIISLLASTSSVFQGFINEKTSSYTASNLQFIKNNTDEYQQTFFSSFSTSVANQFTATDFIVGTFIPSSINSEAEKVQLSISNQSMFLSSAVTTLQEAYSTNTTTLQSTSQFLTGLSNNIFGFHTTATSQLLSQLNTLGAGIINRPQTFYGIDVQYNNQIISSLVYTSPIVEQELNGLYNNLTSFLSSQYYSNGISLKQLYSSSVLNAEYQLVKARRENNTSKILFASTILTSAINSTFGQHYRLVVRSESLDIQNRSNAFTCNVGINAVSSINNGTFFSRFLVLDAASQNIFSTLTSNAVNNFSTLMNTNINTNFVTLLTYNFQKYRFESEATLRQTNEIELANAIIMSNLQSNIRDVVNHDMFYSNLSSIIHRNFSLASDILTRSTLLFSTVALSNNDGRFISNISSLNSSNISTFYGRSIETKDTVFTNLLSSINSINNNALNNQRAQIPFMASSISTFLLATVEPNLSRRFISSYINASSMTITLSNVLNVHISSLSNDIINFKLGQMFAMSNFVRSRTTNAQNQLQTLINKVITTDKIQLNVSTFTTLSTIRNFGNISTNFINVTNTQLDRYPLQIDHHNRFGKNMSLYVNSTFNEVVANKMRITGNFISTVTGGISTIALDLNLYQNFLFTLSDIRLGNVSPFNMMVYTSTSPLYVQKGNIYFSIASATPTEITGQRSLQFQNDGGMPVLLDLETRAGVVKVEYLYENRKMFITKMSDFSH